MLIQEITKYMDFLLSIALFKCDNSQDAEDLVQETILAAITYLNNGNEINDYKSWLSTVLNRKYYDMLRRKYKISTVTISDGFDVCDDTDFVSDVIRAEQEESVRKEVAFLSETYRKIIVSHYFMGKSVKDISMELGIPLGTVKSRLNFGRQQLKKGINDMQNYIENSYMPQILEINNSGRFGMNEEPMSLVANDVLAQNLLILAYERPVTIAELSKAIGVASAYVEPIVKKLVAGELMKQIGDGKVYTDFIIYHASDYVRYIKDQESFSEKYADVYCEAVKKAIRRLKDTSFYSMSLERFMMIEIAERGLYCSMENIRKPQIFPDRPNGGKWIAFGTIYPEDYVVSSENKGKEDYWLSGRRNTYLDSYLDAKDLKIYEYETSLDLISRDKLSGYDFQYVFDIEEYMLKLFYVIKHNIEPEKVDIDNRILKGIPLLCQRGYLSKKGDELKVLIPCLTHDEEREFFDICNDAIKEFGDNIREPLTDYCKTHKIKIPAHLNSVPEQKLTMPYEPKPMMFVYEAINKGIHPRDLGYVYPETIVVFE